MYESGSVSHPLHLTIQPGWPPPEALPARGVAAPKVPWGYCGYSFKGPCVSRCWSRSFTRHRLSTPSCMAHSTRWPRPVFSRWNSAVTMPRARCSPVPESPIWAPATTGGPPGNPVVLAPPPAHWATFS